MEFKLFNGINNILPSAKHIIYLSSDCKRFLCNACNGMWLGNKNLIILPDRFMGIWKRSFPRKPTMKFPSLFLKVQRFRYLSKPIVIS